MHKVPHTTQWLFVAFEFHMQKSYLENKSMARGGDVKVRLISMFPSRNFISALKAELRNINFTNS